MSTTFQLWGPPGGLALTSSSAAAAELPPTGIDASSSIAGALLLAAGTIAIAWSRRRRTTRDVL